MMLAELILTQRIADCVGEWVVAEVTPQHTVVAQRRIEARGIPTFNPSCQIKIANEHGRSMGYVPLFSGYLFACVPDLSHRYEVKEAFGVWGCIYTKDQDRLQRELEAIEALIDADPTMRATRPLKPGVMAEVIRGPLKGKRGIIEREGAGSTFVLPLSMFGRAVPTAIAITDLEPV